MSEKVLGFRDYLRLSEMKVALISLAHCVNDMYAAFLATFIPFIKDNLGLSYTLASNFNVIVGIFHIICQPVIGYMCDRIRRPLLMMIGPVFCGLGAVMVPNARSYGAAVFFAGLWGFGSALYHPQGTGGVGYVSKPEHLTRSLTWFNIAGTVGTMLSPIIAVGTVKALGYKGLLVTLVPALLLAPLIYFSMPFLRDEELASDKRRKGFFKTIGALFAVLYPVWGVSLIRDSLFQCMRFFLPLKIAARGGNLESVGTIVFCLTLGSTLAMIPMGAAAKRFGNKRALQGSMILGAVILLTAAFTTDFLSVVLDVLGISCIYSTLPLTVVVAQTLAPTERSAASSIVMGLSWGVSNILVAPFGKLADTMGLDATFVFLAVLPILGMPFFWARAFKKLAN
ncbi:MAG: MFS transporter [Synergistaceae bacterium]|jgi:FSR family fosmidomycin resistance protein-like MFS transporter|nr:MFS transporter [Synergistaceae bacterium]